MDLTRSRAARDRPRRSPRHTPTTSPPAWTSASSAPPSRGRARRIHPGWDAAGAELSAHAAFITGAAELASCSTRSTPDEWSQRTASTRRATVRDARAAPRRRRALPARPARAARPDRRARPERPLPGPAARAAADLDDARDADVARTWWLEALALIGVVRASSVPTTRSPTTTSAARCGGMLVVRTFELWTHDDDIRRAVGLPLNDLDDERLALMSGALIDVLPLGMALAGTTRPGRTARIELTGPGGGRSFDVAARTRRDCAARPDLTIEASALDLCRLAVEPAARRPARRRGRRRPLAARARAGRRQRLRHGLTAPVIRRCAGDEWAAHTTREAAPWQQPKTQLGSVTATRRSTAATSPALIDLFAEDIVWHFPGTSKLARRARRPRRDPGHARRVRRRLGRHAPGQPHRRDGQRRARHRLGTRHRRRPTAARSTSTPSSSSRCATARSPRRCHLVDDQAALDAFLA